MFKAVKADLSRFNDDSKEFCTRKIIRGILSQGFQALMVYRFFNWCFLHRIPSQPFRFFIERFIEITTGISIPAQCMIGRGMRIHHFGGIIFHPSAEIGDYCTVYHDVTIGDRGGYGGAAKIGHHVLLGVGAKIIGEITIGNKCKISANSVVTEDMPSNTLAFGNPAQFIVRKYDDTIS